MPSWAIFSCAFASAMLVTAATLKLIERGSLAPFLVAVGLPHRLARIMSSLAIPLELLIGVSLLLPTTRLIASLLAVALASAFLALQVRAARLAGRPSCRCFGPLAVEDDRLVLARTALLFLAATAGVLLLIFGSQATDGASPLLGSSILGLASGLAMVLAIALASQVLRFEKRRPRFRPGVVLAGES